jgi:hypothetical protein
MMNALNTLWESRLWGIVSDQEGWRDDKSARISIIVDYKPRQALDELNNNAF